MLKKILGKNALALERKIHPIITEIPKQDELKEVHRKTNKK